MHNSMESIVNDRGESVIRLLRRHCRNRRKRRVYNCDGWRVYYILLVLILLPVLAHCYRPVQAQAISAEVVSQEHRTLPSAVVSSRILQDKVAFNPKPYGDKNDKSRRDLSGLGSSPPQCNSKCGYCTPCRAVHVPIQPGFVKTTEYYPEAWRCKCGNKLYMP